MGRKKYYLTVLLLAGSLPVFTAGTAGESRKVDALVTPMRDPVRVTVGGPEADIPGYTSRAIQLAVDAVKARGGGTVRLFTTEFLVDADWGMLKVTVQDSGGFRVGGGIQLFDDLHHNGWDVTTARITSIRGNILYLDNATVNDYIASENGTISNSFSLIEGIGVENVRISDLTVDGSKSSNLYLNGCRGGGVYLHKARNCIIEGVTVRNFNGDSFSWQVTKNITIRRCEAAYGTGLGFHPGTGSDHSIVEHNTSHHNEKDGFFLCWRVQNSVFRNNTSYGNGRYGISIGHKDTDNLFENNHIYENAFHGVMFRDENEQNAGHRNTFRGNVIENNGTSGEDAYGFYISGVTHDIVIEDNTIRSTGQGRQVCAVFVGKDTDRITVRSNRISGHPETVRE